MISLKFFFIFLFSLNFYSLDAVQVKTKQGIVEGVLSTSRNGTEFYSFYGIPFAKPPIGELRFELPQEPDSWQGVRDANLPPPICIQYDVLILKPTTVIGQEDCLYLNVFTPNVTFSSLLPVMVYIHGGGFFSGASSIHSPEYFMDHPIVVVTIQYRLAIFGFLSTVDEFLPGNLGLKDQVAALKWVQQNIKSFGGDPNSVTIVGNSAGAASVHLHIHSPLSTGLFHRAISQSGTALAMWAITPPQMARERARALGVLSGCPELSSKELKECLKNIPATELAESHNKFYIWDIIQVIPFGVVVEPENVPEAFLLEHPWKQNVVNNVPWIVGIAENEGGVLVSRFLSKPDLMNQWIHNYERLLPLAFFYSDKLDKKNVTVVTSSIKKFYFGNEDIHFETVKKFIDMFTDGYFTVDSVEAAKRHNNEVYFYMYRHRNTHTFNSIFGNVTENLGVCHADELLSLFHLVTVFPPANQGVDLTVSQKMVNYWVNFVREGNPNGGQQLWEPFHSKKINYLNIRTDSDFMETTNSLHVKYEFWKNKLFSLLPHSQFSLPLESREEL